jgi:hypothetical protein
MLSVRSSHVSIAAIALAAACSDENPTGPAYRPDIPAGLSASVTNPLFPLSPGTTLTYAGDSEDGTESIVVEILTTTRMVNGIEARVVRDRVYLDGELVEDTDDWYAQDPDGNVWYLGEDSKEIDDGTVVSTEGSWEWGVDGALPGIIMWADPSAHVGEAYRQEFYEDEAEDWGKVRAVDASITVPHGTLAGCAEIEEWNALESGSLERKYYCPGVGFALEITAEGERVELIAVTP